MIRCLAVLCCLLALSPAVRAHPDANTIAVAEFNRETSRLEVSLRIFPEVLEEALKRHHDRVVSLSESDEVDALIAKYLSKTISVAPPKPAKKEDAPEVEEPTPIRWVGKELSPKAVWIYFEIPIDGEIDRVIVRQSMLFELFPEQINTFTIEDGDRRATAVLSRLQPTSRLRWKRVDEKNRPDRRRDGIRF